MNSIWQLAKEYIQSKKNRMKLHLNQLEKPMHNNNHSRCYQYNPIKINSRITFLAFKSISLINE